MVSYQCLVGVADLHVVEVELDGGGVEGVLAVHPDERRPLQRHLRNLLAHIGGGGADDQKQRRQDQFHFEHDRIGFDSASVLTSLIESEITE